MPRRQHFAPDEPRDNEAASAEHAAEPPLPEQEIGSHAVAPEDSDSDSPHAEQQAANGMPVAEGAVAVPMLPLSTHARALVPNSGEAWPPAPRS